MLEHNYILLLVQNLYLCYFVIYSLGELLLSLGKNVKAKPKAFSFFYMVRCIRSA